MVARTIKAFITGVMLLGTCIATARGDIEVYSDIAPSSGTLDDQFVFSVTVEGTQEASYPEITGGDDFDISLIGPEQNIEIINGSVSAKITYNYQLIPRKTGKLKTPAASLKIRGKKYHTRPLTVLVSKTLSPSLSTQTNRVFIHQSAAPRSQVYVGQQIINTIEIGARINLKKYELEDTTLDGFWSTPFGNRASAVRVINGYRYKVYTEKEALFPLRAGKLEIPARKSTVLYSDNSRRRTPFPFGSDLFDDMFFGFGGRPIERTIVSNSLPLTVKNLPPAPAHLSTWGQSSVIVGHTELSISYSGKEINFGDSKTVEVKLESRGNISPIKEVKLGNSKKFKVYQETPQQSLKASGGMLVMTRIFRLSIVPKVGGKIEIPSLKLSYFDPSEKIYKTAESVPIVFSVKGGPETEAIRSPHTPNQTPVTAENERYPVYREETALEKLSSQISLSLAVLIFSALLLAAIFVFIFVRHRKAAAPMRKIQQAITRAGTIKDLDSSFRDLLSLKLSENCSALGTEQLKALLRQKVQNQDLIFGCQSVLDQLDTLKYSSQKAGEISHLKELILEIRKSWGFDI